MLDELGLGPDAAAVYGVMLRTPQLGRQELAGILGWAPDRIEDAWDELLRLALLRPSEERPGRMRLVDPELSLQRLLARQEQRLLERQKAVAEARFEISRMLIELMDEAPGTGPSGVRQFTGEDAVRSRLERYAYGCEREFALFAPRGPRLESSPEASRVLEQGVVGRRLRARYLCVTGLAGDRDALAHARWLRGSGAEVRAVPELPLRMALFDGRTAVLLRDPDQLDEGILVLDGGPAVTALNALFELQWQRSEPLDPEPEPADDERPTGHERAVLELLAAGHTDEVVARKLGISVRTGRRVTAHLLERLQARSRFQAGVLAAARGWLTPVPQPPSPVRAAPARRGRSDRGAT
ncbi:LuxR C-terminal-related transcriptional regulator [Streptomyces sp. NPDC003758]